MRKVPKKKILRGTFGFGNCTSFTRVNQKYLTTAIRNIIKDNNANVSYECGSIHFLVMSHSCTGTINGIKTELEQKLNNDPTFGPHSAFRLRTVPEKTESCSVQNGLGVLSENKCFIIKCNQQYTVQLGVDGVVFACLPSKDSNDSNNILLIAILAAQGALILIIIIAVVCYCRRKSSKSKVKELPAAADSEMYGSPVKDPFSDFKL